MAALVLGWIFWLPIHTCTYAAVPLRYRLFWVKFCSIWWRAGLSTLNSQEASTLISQEGAATSADKRPVSAAKGLTNSECN